MTCGFSREEDDALAHDEGSCALADKDSCSAERVSIVGVSAPTPKLTTTLSNESSVCRHTESERDVCHRCRCTCTAESVANVFALVTLCVVLHPVSRHSHIDMGKRNVGFIALSER